MCVCVFQCTSVVVDGLCEHLMTGRLGRTLNTRGVCVEDKHVARLVECLKSPVCRDERVKICTVDLRGSILTDSSLCSLIHALCPSLSTTHEKHERQIVSESHTDDALTLSGVTNSSASSNSSNDSRQDDAPLELIDLTGYVTVGPPSILLLSRLVRHVGVNNSSCRALQVCLAAEGSNSLLTAMQRTLDDTVQTHTHTHTHDSRTHTHF